MLTVQLDIPEVIEEQMRADASRAGLDFETWVARRLCYGYEHLLKPTEPDTGLTLYDRLLPILKPLWDEIDAEKSRKGDAEDGDQSRGDARRHSELFTDYLVQKKKDGHL